MIPKIPGAIPAAFINKYEVASVVTRHRVSLSRKLVDPT
jgi:hypothetical protein